MMLHYNELIVQREDCDYFKPSNVDQFYYSNFYKKQKIMV